MVCCLDITALPPAQQSRSAKYCDVTDKQAFLVSITTRSTNDVAQLARRPEAVSCDESTAAVVVATAGSFASYHASTFSTSMVIMRWVYSKKLCCRRRRQVYTVIFIIATILSSFCFSLNDVRCVDDRRRSADGRGRLAGPGDTEPASDHQRYVMIVRQSSVVVRIVRHSPFINSIVAGVRRRDLTGYAPLPLSSPSGMRPVALQPLPQQPSLQVCRCATVICLSMSGR
jgi:hypothetical protein